MDFVNTIMQGVCVHLIGSWTVGAPVRFSTVVVMRSHVRLSRVDHSCSHIGVCSGFKCAQRPLVNSYRFGACITYSQLVLKQYIQLPKIHKTNKQKTIV